MKILTMFITWYLLALIYFLLAASVVSVISSRYYIYLTPIIAIVFSSVTIYIYKYCINRFRISLFLKELILILNYEEAQFGKNFASKNKIGKNELVIGINTGAGSRWQDKKLSVEETAELIDKLNNQIKNSKIILFGGPEEKERNENIKKSVKTKIIDTGCNNSLMEFASLVNLCSILVTSDSLALHIGTALKKKIVAFFYPTSASEIELYGRGIKIIGKGKSYCSYQPRCDYPPEWDIDEIVKAVKKLT